ncbi:MAG: glycoside hydrolase TIM-barrel-like domain-containing protein [Rickettsiaceae bacterium]|nr:glycoside hydrolase TIM-barrel-like domain-containing protein [Rickettsiaceae bacterium]
MFSSFFSLLSEATSNIFGEGMFSSASRFISKWIGVEAEKPESDKDIPSYKIAKHKNKLYLVAQTANYHIPLIFGKAKAEGRLIFASIIREEAKESTVANYFAKYLRSKISVEFLYYCDFAIGICEGEIESIERIWCDGEIIDISPYVHRIYKGTQDQMPDSIIEQHAKNKIAPAHRGLAYIVFENFPLYEFGNQIPKFSFEVTRKPKLSSNTKTVEKKIKAVNIIPGSGEFVYDTEIQTKKISYENQEVATITINANNKDAIADAIYSLNYLNEICPNLEWVAPVVSWFADNVDIAKCSIYPAVESKDITSTKYSSEWRVENFTRETAKEISKNEDNNPTYGGTVNDESLVRYLKELKTRKLKIIFYPMIFLDVEGKPWRGHMTGESASVPHFFRKEDGYNRFILHYANLCKDLVDAFIIGTELKSLTSIRDENGGKNEFPAVSELILLSDEVRQILGNHVKITYAADWSEYHHTKGGWYHLDELWASKNIDFIGIDNYMPLTREEFSEVSEDDIKSGFISGDGFEYFFDGDQKIKLQAEYAWKNVKWWWENEHENPNGQKTSWIPKSKKIWFTEYGFPSIDKATNQPNVFYDPACVDGGAPVFSNQNTNFAIQRTAINAFIDFWSEQEYVENMFLWCFDARPYPAWPHGKIWTDNYLWEKGHWINGKLGGMLLSDVITDISLICDIRENDLDFRDIDHYVHGINLSKSVCGFELINLFRSVYFFDLQDRQDGGIGFVRRGRGRTVKIESQDFIFSDEVIKIKKFDQSSKPGVLNIRFANSNNNYSLDQEYVRLDNGFDNHKYFSVPFTMTIQEARDIASTILAQIYDVTGTVEFRLPFDYFFLAPSDLINFEYIDYIFTLRICRSKKEKYSVFITASIEKFKQYNNSLPSHFPSYYYLENERQSLKQILIENMQDIYSEKCIFFVNFGQKECPLLIGRDGGNMMKVANVKGSTVSGHLEHCRLIENPFHLLKDEYSYIDVTLNGQFEKVTQVEEADIEIPFLYQGKIVFAYKAARLSHNSIRLRHFVFSTSITKIIPKKHDKIIFLDKVAIIPLNNDIYESLIYQSSFGEVVEYTQVIN